MTAVPGLDREDGARLPSTTDTGRLSGLERFLLLGLALAAAAASVVLSSTVFGHLSINNDESIYRLQADALAHGHLFGPAPYPADAFRPWLAAVVDDHYVLKYTPVFPGLLAVSMVLTGGPLLSLALVAAGAVVTTHVLALEVLRDRRAALVTAALFAASPVVVVQSGLLLPYLLTVVLLDLFTWGLLRGVAPAGPGGEEEVSEPSEARARDRRPLVVAGAALGVAVVARPFDAVLFALPVVIGVLVRGRWRHLTLRQVAYVAVPVAAAAAGFLAYNLAATGNPLRPTFSLLDPRDSLGFGDRFLYPSDIPHHFGPRQGLEGIARNGSLLVGWMAGGVVLVSLALATLLRRRAPAPILWLTASAGLLVTGYGFFWGPWNAASQWGGTRFVGPFYFLPAVVPVTLLAARSLTDLWRRQRWIGGAIVVAMTAVSAATLATVLVDNAAFERNNEALDDLVDDHARNGLVFAVLPDPYLMHPTPVVANRWDLSGPVVYAIQGQDDLEAMAAMPDRKPWQLTFDGSFIFPDQPFTARLQPLKLTSAPEVRLHLKINALRTATAMTVTAFGTTTLYPLTPTESMEDTLLITPEGARLQLRQPTQTWPAQDEGSLTITLLSNPTPGTPGLVAAHIPTRTTASLVEVLAPSGPALTRGPNRAPPIEVMPHAVEEAMGGP